MYGSWQTFFFYVRNYGVDVVQLYAVALPHQSSPDDQHMGLPRVGSTRETP